MDEPEQIDGQRQVAEIDEEHKEALKRAVVAMDKIRRRTERGTLAKTFEETLSHLSGIIEHAKYNKMNPENRNDFFVLKNRDQTYDVVVVVDSQDLRWMHLTRYDKDASGYCLWGPTHENDSVMIDVVSGSNIFTDTGEIDVSKIQSEANPFQDWTFSDDGEITYHEDPDSTKGLVKVSVNETPLENFLPRREEVPASQ